MQRPAYQRRPFLFHRGPGRNTVGESLTPWSTMTHVTSGEQGPVPYSGRRGYYRATLRRISRQPFPFAAFRPLSRCGAPSATRSKSTSAARRRSKQYQYFSSIFPENRAVWIPSQNAGFSSIRTTTNGIDTGLVPTRQPRGITKTDENRQCPHAPES